MIRLATVLAATLCVLTLHSPARAAEDYPSKPITIVVSLAAGTGMDVVTRLYAEKLSQALGKPVIVENKPGAATTLAANQVANAPADGYTLVVLTSIALSINPTLYKHLNYDPADFVPISLYVKSPFILSTYAGLPAKTVPEFIKLRQGEQPAADIRVDRRRLAAADVDGVRQEAVRLRGHACAVLLDRTARQAIRGGELFFFDSSCVAGRGRSTTRARRRTISRC